MKNSERYRFFTLFVSFIISSLNSSKILPTAIEHIKNQGYPAFEVLLFDGRTTDDTIAVAKAYSYKVVDNPRR